MASPDPARMASLTREASTKADKIRILAAAGYSRVAIRDFLGIRYQHVRNVLVDSASRVAGVAEPVPPYGRLVVSADGRLVLPPDFVAALDGRPGEAIPWRLENGELSLMGKAAGRRFSLQRVQEAGRGDEASWSDALIAERRAAAADE